MPPNSSQFIAFVQSILHDADDVLLPGQFAKHLTPELIVQALDRLEPLLPNADLILALASDDAPLIFELSMRLRIPFVSAKVIDLVASDDTESSGFLQDPNLLQVQAEQTTWAIAKHAIAPNSRVLIFHDVLENGITTLGLVSLVNRAFANTIGVATLIEKSHFAARGRLAMHGIEVFAALVLAKKRERLIVEKRKIGIFDFPLSFD